MDLDDPEDNGNGLIVTMVPSTGCTAGAQTPWRQNPPLLYIHVKKIREGNFGKVSKVMQARTGHLYVMKTFKMLRTSGKGPSRI